MPGFLVGIEDNEKGIQAPSGPVYTYTWKFDQMTDLQLPDTIYCKECVLPEYAVESEEYQSPHIKYKYAKGITWNDVKVTFYDTKGIKDQLEKLKKQVWSPTTGIQPASEYKRESKISVYLADDTTLEQEWTLYNSWIKGISWSQLTYTSSDVHNVTVILAYDWAEVK